MGLCTRTGMYTHAHRVSNRAIRHKALIHTKTLYKQFGGWRTHTVILTHSHIKPRQIKLFKHSYNVILH